MGIDQHIYLGPYSKVKRGKVSYTETVTGCSKCRKEIYEKDVNFCPTCGTKIGAFGAVKEKRRTNPFEVMDEFGENLTVIQSSCGFDTDWEYWIPNVRRLDRNPNIEGNDDFKLCLNLSKEDLMKEEIEEYITKFKKEIGLVEQYYGEVSQEWGLLVWYS